MASNSTRKRRYGRRSYWNPFMDIADFMVESLRYRRTYRGRRRRYGRRRRRKIVRLPYKWRRRLRPFRYNGPPVLVGVAALLLEFSVESALMAVGAANFVALVLATWWEF